MLTFTLMKPEGILRLHPSGPLTEADFARLRTEVDAYLLSHARLNGVLVRAAEFPGWENWAGLSAHQYGKLHTEHDLHGPGSSEPKRNSLQQWWSGS